METVTGLLNKIINMCHTFGPSEWAVISVLTIVFGYVCMKGFSVR